MNLRTAQSDKAATAIEAHPLLILNQLVMGGWFWRETLRPLYGPSAPVNVLLALSPLRSTLTVLVGPGDFALRISRREYCLEPGSRSRTDDPSDGLTTPTRSRKL
jgi:hypothetical protein